MRTFRYAHFNTANGLVHFPKHQSIRIQDIIAFSTVEKLMTGIDALLTGISAVSLISTGLWYLLLPTAALGTAVDTDIASATISIIAAMGVVSAMIALPIAVIIYRHLIGEAKILQTSLARSLLEGRQQQKKIFIKLIRLRSLYEKDLTFVNELSNCKQLSTLSTPVDKLLSLVNRIHGDKIKEPLRKALDDCFETVDHRGKHWVRATAYGVVAGLSMIVITMTVGWGVASFAIALKLTDVIPTIGWITFNISTLAMGMLFCLGIGMGKYKKLIREAMRDQLIHKNQLLMLMSERISHLSTQRMVDLVKKQANQLPLKQLKMK